MPALQSNTGAGKFQTYKGNDCAADANLLQLISSFIAKNIAGQADLILKTMPTEPSA